MEYDFMGELMCQAATDSNQPGLGAIESPTSVERSSGREFFAG
jgi:hypothetical protein